MTYYSQNRDKYRTLARDRNRRIKDIMPDDVKAYQALYYQLNKEDIYRMQSEKRELLKSQKPPKAPKQPKAFKEPKPSKEPKIPRQSCARKPKIHKEAKQLMIRIINEPVFLSFD